MSRAYQVTWVRVASTVTSSDSLAMKLSLLGILPEGEMAALLRDELAREGWTRQADGTMSGAVQGLDATLDAAATTVTVRASAEKDVKAQGTSDADAHKALSEAAVRARDELLADMGRRLSAVEPDLRATVGEAIQRVYVEALRRKAASMGEVESERQTRSADGEYEVTIKVRV